MKEYIQNEKTLRLMMCFDKFTQNRDVTEAFNVLSRLEKTKAQYIVQAVKTCEHMDDTLLSAQSTLRQLNYIRIRYRLKDKSDLVELMNDDQIFDSIRSNTIEPRKMLLGFRIGDPDAEALHARLFDMCVNDRIFLVTRCVLAYVNAGHDPQAELWKANRMLKELRTLDQDDVWRLMRAATLAEKPARHDDLTKLLLAI